MSDLSRRLENAGIEVMNLLHAAGKGDIDEWFYSRRRLELRIAALGKAAPRAATDLLDLPNDRDCVDEALSIGEEILNEIRATLAQIHGPVGEGERPR
jgi:hypothetical protein